ncbi:hypothetical protein Pan44_26680 [Caulifigura coniformis]|uniref:Uncharacterized protein n=1 Tax=Caulifigura coniformis TaxID=2527983 RepID=A0A517SES3_9PLAN|nr:hypothetical protein [Caulifigura coniformis]QDT54633.1 hypothetical protein Pan44_26680 [Caulifigura coniformis]
MASFRDSYKVPVLIPDRDPVTNEQRYDAAGNSLFKQKFDDAGNPEFKPEPRLWVVTITYGVALELKRRHEVDLLSDKLDIEKVLKDPMTVLMILDVALEKQLGDRDMRIEDLPKFIENQEVAWAMDDAVMEAVIDFFPKRLSEPLLKSRKRIREAASKREKIVADRLEEMLGSPELMMRVEQGMDRDLAKMEAEMNKELEAVLGPETSGTSPSSSVEPSAS